MKLYRLPLVPFKRRTKATHAGNRFRVYTPIESQREEQMVAAAYQGKLYEGPVVLELHVYRVLPKSRPKRVESEPDTYKPDIDNIIKSVMDGLNGVAYKDDSQVVEIKAVKHDRARRKDEGILFGVEPVEGR